MGLLSYFFSSTSRTSALSHLTHDRILFHEHRKTPQPQLDPNANTALASDVVSATRPLSGDGGMDELHRPREGPSYTTAPPLQLGAAASTCLSEGCTEVAIP